MSRARTRAHYILPGAHAPHLRSFINRYVHVLCPPSDHTVASETYAECSSDINTRARYTLRAFVFDLTYCCQFDYSTSVGQFWKRLRLMTAATADSEHLSLLQRFRHYSYFAPVIGGRPPLKLFQALRVSCCVRLAYVRIV